jgi:AcrR family transcriptional regulator
MPSLSHDQQKERTRRAFIQATIALILEKGYDAVSVTDIAERAGYGRGTFYLHFDNKEDVVWSILRRYFENLNALIREDADGASPASREYRSWVAMFENAGQLGQFFRLLNGSTAQTLRRRQRDYLTDLTIDNLERGLYAPLGDLPPEFAARTIVGATIELLEWWVLSKPAYTPQEMAAMLFRIIYCADPPTEETGP